MTPHRMKTTGHFWHRDVRMMHSDRSKHPPGECEQNESICRKANLTSPATKHRETREGKMWRLAGEGESEEMRHKRLKYITVDGTSLKRFTLLSFFSLHTNLGPFGNEGFPMTPPTAFIPRRGLPRSSTVLEPTPDGVTSREAVVTSAEDCDRSSLRLLISVTSNIDLNSLD